jgi:hypothetical protein
MVNFRRVVTVLAVLVLFTGLAFAQQETCSAQGTASNPLRAEGYTEESGDIVITCVSGAPLAPGTNIPLVNITVFYNTTVTSRLLSDALASGQVPSDALLLIDEPNTHIGSTPNITTPISFGSTLPLIPCLTPATGCAQVVGATGVAGYATAVLPGADTACTGAVSASCAPNVYQGVTSGNSVTFYGVPVLPPSTVGSRIYRITNVRVNATTGGVTQGQTPVQAFITVSGAASLPISNSQPIVGYIQTSLTAKVSGAGNFNQCVSQAINPDNGKPIPGAQLSGTLVFQELFGSAFKTRVDAKNNPALGAGQVAVSTPKQNVPGIPVNSESNFVYADAYGTSAGTVGLADFGTRLKATFNNVPAGVHIYVTSTNIGANASAIATPGGSGGNSFTGDSGVDQAGLAMSVSGDSSAESVPTKAAALKYTEVTIVAGTGTAVWEVINTNPNLAESFEFQVAIAYTAATATNTPLPGTSTVTLSYAPTATSGAASSGPIPRFAAGSFTGNSFTINVCRTVLLYPYITNQGGFDTGVTVANTSTDPFGTGAQAGACTFNYYGGTTAAPTTPPAPTTTGVIASGTVYAETLGTLAPTFQGYMFAICNFQYAHGFAFISDVGARNLAMGYLALIIPDPAVTGRPASPFATGDATGEQDAH